MLSEDVIWIIIEDVARSNQSVKPNDGSVRDQMYQHVVRMAERRIMDSRERLTVEEGFRKGLIWYGGESSVNAIYD